MSRFVPKSGYWEALIGGERVVTISELPPALSPIYLRWDESGIFGEVQYLAIVATDPTPHAARVYRRGQAPRGAAEDGWEMLQRWVEESEILPATESGLLVQQCRIKIEWLLDAGWTEELAAPMLVRRRIEEACAAFPGVEAQRINAWVHALLG